MAEQKPNPLLGAVVGMVQDRQAADVARLELLAHVSARVDTISETLKAVRGLLEELVERSRK